MDTTNPCARAAYLRGEATSMPTPIATAYKRRAAELELKAYILGAFEPMAQAA